MRRVDFASVSYAFMGLALCCLLLADLAVTSVSPWSEMRRLIGGILGPDLLSIEAWSVAWTVAFAVLGVALGASCGLALAIVYPHSRLVRGLAVVLRSIHELFWALLLIQIFGLGPTTGILAIALPYMGYFAKVYAEIIEEADLSAARVLPAGTGLVSAFLFARLPEIATHLKTYTLYRLECGMRSTLVLGFVGLPTIGFHLETYFKQGHYAAAAALLGVFYVLVGTRRLWARPQTVPVLIVASLLVLPATIGGGSALANLVRFVTIDIVPSPLRNADLMAAESWLALWTWARPILIDQALPGVAQTLILAQVALVAAGLMALIVFPVVSRRFAGAIGQPAGRVLLVVVRSTPEYMMAYVLLLVLGPSMLPAIIALAVHNGGIVGYLMGRHADQISHRLDAPRGVNLYAFETVPRLYGQFLAYMLYRWEIIVRESAIFGILGIGTLGYFVDAAIAELRLDAAMLLIAVTVALSVVIDLASRRLRGTLRIAVLPTRLSSGQAVNCAHQVS